MGKLVLGIVVVFCLSLAFILFIRGGGDLVELAQAIDVRSADPVLVSQELDIPELAAQNNTPDEDIYDVQIPQAVSFEHTLRRAIPTQSIKRVEIAKKVRSEPLDPYALNEPAEPFTDTVIWIERASFVADSQNDRVEKPLIKTHETPAANFAPSKRSFFSRARPVVRKPYDWIKAFATKLF